jgi:inorganic triphosphatase YgiF
MDGSLEVELKFRADSEATLHVLATAQTLGSARLGPARQVDEVDRYLDTSDLRLSAAGWACRLRSREGRTRVSLKGPSAAGARGALHRRPELDGPATDQPDPHAWPPSGARDALLAMSGGAPLGERFTLRQGRRERSVTLDGSEIGTLSLDDVRVEHAGVERGRCLVVELELTDEAARRGLDTVPLQEALLAAGGLEAEPRTKLERALALLDAAGA